MTNIMHEKWTPLSKLYGYVKPTPYGGSSKSLSFPMHILVSLSEAHEVFIAIKTHELLFENKTKDMTSASNKHLN